MSKPTRIIVYFLIMAIFSGLAAMAVFSMMGFQFIFSPSFKIISPTVPTEVPTIAIPMIKPSDNDLYSHFSYYKAISLVIIDDIETECSPYANGWYDTVGMTYYLANQKNNDQPTATYTTVVSPTYHYGSFYVSYLYEDSKWSVADEEGRGSANEEDIIKGALAEHDGIVYFEAIYDITKNEFGNHYNNMSCLVVKQ